MPAIGLCSKNRFTILLAVALLTPLARPAAAAELTDHAVSLEAIPADAAFYAAWLKCGEEVEAMQETGAWKKLTTIPGIQLGWMQLQTQWQYPSDPRVQMVKDWVDSTDGQDVLAVLGEMGSDEIFLYGGSGFTSLIELVLEANAIKDGAQFEQLMGLMNKDAGGEPNEQEQAEYLQEEITSLLDTYAEELVAPDLVLGFKVRDRERAITLLDRYEAPLRDALAMAPAPLAQRLRRESDGDTELLTIDFDADMLPWDQIESEWEASPELLAAIRAALDGKQIAFTIGVVADFVVLSMGDTNDHLSSEHDGPLLKDRDELQRLAGHAGERLRSIGYASGDFLKAANSTHDDLQELAELGKAMLLFTDVDDDRRDAMEQDVDALLEQVLFYVPEAGAVAGVSFATDRGYEGFTYNWGGIGGNLDATQPLTLMDHVGAESIGWAVGRGSYSAERFDQMAKLGSRVLEHVEALVEPEVEPEKWQEYVVVRDKVLPLVNRFGAATRDYLIPGLADGQSAVVFEATAADDTWCDYMPPAGQELPLPSLSLVFGVSDAGAVKAAAGEYFAIIEDAIGLAREMDPEKVPPFELPAPVATDHSAGTVYAYELPPVAGASDRLAPNAALGDSALVLSLLPEVGEALLAGSRPELDGPAADFSRPLLSASHFKFAKLLDLLRPWIDYGVKVGVENAGEEGAQAAAMVGFVKPQVDQLLDVLQAWDSYTGVTYREDDAWVTHGETRFIDLED